MCASALSLNSLHSFHPAAAASQFLCCASRKPTESIALDSTSLLTTPLQCRATLTDSGRQRPHSDHCYVPVWAGDDQQHGLGPPVAPAHPPPLSRELDNPPRSSQPPGPM